MSLKSRADPNKINTFDDFPYSFLSAIESFKCFVTDLCIEHFSYSLSVSLFSPNETDFITNLIHICSRLMYVCSDKSPSLYLKQYLPKTHCLKYTVPDTAFGMDTFCGSVLFWATVLL